MKSGVSGGGNGPGGSQDPPAVSFATVAEFEDAIQKRVAAALEEQLGNLPQKYATDGTINLAHFRERYSRLNRKVEIALAGGGKLPHGFAQYQKSLDSELKLHGLSLKDILDDRGEARKLDDAVERLIAAPESALMEEADATLLKIRERCERAVQDADRVLREKQEELDEAMARQRSEEAEQAESRADSAKRWMRRIETVLRIREMVRKPVPTFANPVRSSAWRATRALRLMIAVFRSDVATGDPILDIGPHHVAMSIDFWRARDQVTMFAKGFPLYPKGGCKSHDSDCHGLIVLAPPRHTKTTFVGAAIASMIADNPKMQWKFTHCIEDGAIQNKHLVGQCFTWGLPKYETPVSRRMKAIFPNLPKAKRCSDTVLRLYAETKDPTIFAAGLTNAVSGANADGVWADDYVDRKVVEQPSARDRDHKELTQKWMRRVQGKNYFVILSATLWHEDDATGRLMAQANAGEIDYIVSLHRVGGPNSSPPFFSIWDRYPPAELRKIYRTMRDPLGYARMYEIDPRAASDRIVKRLALYLSGFGDCLRPTPEQRREVEAHREFLKSARFYLSLDPAATTHDKSDKASLGYFASGTVKRIERTEDQEITRTVDRIRLIEARQFAANQLEGVEAVKDFAIMRKVDEVIIEGVSGYRVSGELIQREFPGVRVHIKHPQAGSGNRGASKLIRLKRVAAMLDDGLRDVGLNPPVVEFPGILNEKGEMIPDPSFKWIMDQIVYAGKTGEDHGLDMTTQACAHLQGEVMIGEGEFSKAVRLQGDKVKYQPRPSFLPQIDLRPTPERRYLSAAEEECAWMDN